MNILPLEPWEFSMKTYKMHKFILTNMEFESQKIFCGVYFDASNHPLDIMVEKQLFEDHPFPNEAIYVGKVSKILPNQGAFVRISPNESGYLPLSEKQSFYYVRKNGKKEALSCEDEILVQIKKQPIKTKEMVLDSSLSFHGDHLILVMNAASVSVSQKLKKSEKQHYKELLSNRFPDMSEFGFVVRTNAVKISDEELLDEAKGLFEEYKHLMAYGKNRTCYECVKKGKDIIEEALRRIDPSICEIETDDEHIYQSLLSIMEKDMYAPFKEHLKFNEDTSYELSKLYGISTVLENALKPVAWLNSGSNLIIEQTESMTVVDVNSSKNNTKKETTAFQVNIESAKELALQMRLRNLSGIIIVDFINMTSEENKSQLLSVLREETKYDPCKVTVLDYTKLGLVEITREKRYPSLKEVLTLKK